MICAIMLEMAFKMVDWMSVTVKGDGGMFRHPLLILRWFRAGEALSRALVRFKEVRFLLSWVFSLLADCGVI